MRMAILVVSVLTIVLTSCDGGVDHEGAPATGPQGSASASPEVGAPEASPTPELRIDFDLPPFGELVQMFDYDPSEPLGYEVLDERREGGATIYDIAYQSSGYSVPAYLVIPEGRGPFPVIEYAHGYTLDREFFLLDAVAFARKGVAGLLILGPGAREPYVKFFSENAAQDVQGHVRYVVDLRRGIDVLESLPLIDADRIGFVGHSLGCQVGGILSGVEDRVDAFVLMSCVGYATDPAWIEFGGSDRRFARYQDRLAVINPVNYVSMNRGAAFLIQASKSDSGASVPNIRELSKATHESDSLRWFDGGHGLGCFGFGVSCDPTLPAFAFHRVWLLRHV